MLELRVPRDRSGLFSTALFERYQRSKNALVDALAEMYVQGVSTRKVKEVTETLCGHGFSATLVSEMNRTLDTALTAFATRRRDEPYPYLILDARYERAREGGIIASQAVLIAVAVDREGRRQIIGVELASRQSARSWRRPHGSAVTCIFCAMRWITCRGGPTTIACTSCAGSTTGATWRRG
jgi:putative transposase